MRSPRHSMRSTRRSMPSFDTDVVIVGAGPTGLACGIELSRAGVRATLIDKGCVVNSLYNYPTNLVFFIAIGLLFLVSLQYGAELTRIEDKIRTLAEQSAFHERRLAELEQAGSDSPDELGAPPADGGDAEDTDEPR